MYKIELLDGSIEYWNLRIIDKIRRLKNGNWEIIHFNKFFTTTEILSFSHYPHPHS
jgi:hypothetical protein